MPKIKISDLVKGEYYWILPDGDIYPKLTYFDGSFLLTRENDKRWFYPNSRDFELISHVKTPTIRRKND
jgi:hypothetical protein